jgi:hypothetical protein
MDKIIENITLKVEYYEMFTKIKRAGMGCRYEELKKFIQEKITNNAKITLNDFENELFQKLAQIYHEMEDMPDMIGFEGQGEGDY